MIKAKNQGIPRTAKAAIKRGLPKLDIKFSQLSERDLSEFNLIHLDIAGARVGTIAAIGTVPAGYPGVIPGTHMVCYIDERGEKVCHAVID